VSGLPSVFSAVTVALLVTGVVACESANTADSLSCRSREAGSVQVLLGRRDAGVVTSDAYRLSDAGLLSRARWDGDDRLSGVSATIDIGADAYSRSLATLSAVEPVQGEDSDGGATSSPSVFTTEIAIAEPRQAVDYTFVDALPAAIADLLADLDRRAALGAPDSGTHVWTMPGSPDLEMSDVALAQPDCEDAVIATLDTAALAPEIVVNAPSEFDERLTDGRSRYVARSVNGFVYFGVLSAP